MASSLQSTGVIHTSSTARSVSDSDLPFSNNEKNIKTSTGDVQSPYGSIEEGEESEKPTRMGKYVAAYNKHRKVILSVVFGAVMTG